MLTALLLCALQAPARPVPPPATGQAAARARTLGELHPRARDGSIESFTGSPTSFDEPFLSVRPTASPGVYGLKFNGTGTGWQEPFLLGVPKNPLAPAPLLVMWHAYGVTELDCVTNTGLFKRAMERGWYVVAPRGAHDVNFGIGYAQRNTAYVLDWVLSTFTIDAARIYGAGFSMGGGTALSFAARHLDPAGPLFAALVNHTGTVSVANAHASESAAVKAILENPLMFGGPPSQFPFEYAQASAIDLAPDGVTVDASTDLARNLQHVPVATWTATFDPIAYLLAQSDAVHNWLLGLGAGPTRVEVVSNLHSWRTLNGNDALDWLEARVLTVPTSGTHRLLADRDGRWLHFEVQQDAPGAFTPVRWNMDPLLNRVVIDQTANLARLEIDTSALGLDPAFPLSVVIAIADGGADEVALDGYASAPTDVQRNGQSTAAWSHDAGSGVLTLFESDGAGYPQWLVVP